MQTIFGLLASWAVLATLSALAIVSLGGTGNWLSPSKRQPAYGALTRVAAPMLPYRSGEPDPDALSRDVAKLRLKAEDQDLRPNRAAKPRSPHTFATSRDPGRSFGGGAVGDRHTSNF